MSNLLPRIDKRRIRTAYHLRLATLWLTMLGIAFVIASFLFAPAYLLTRVSERTAAETLTAMKASSTPEYQTALKDIDDANILAKRLLAKRTHVSVTDIVGAIDTEVTEGIVLSGITYEVSEKDILVLSVEGTATTRDTLASFIERLKKNRYVSEASVPFEQLAQATNARFTATVMVKPLTE
jgi:hypothetical protein